MSLSDEERNTIVRLEIEKSKNTFAEVGERIEPARQMIRTIEALI